MGIEGSIRFNFGDGRPTEDVRFAVGDADEAVLRIFLHEARMLEDSVNRQGGFDASYHVSWKEGEPIAITGTEPTADQRAVVLHRLRPFLLQNEPAYFHVVRGIVVRSSDSVFLRSWLDQTKARFTGKHLQQQVLISMGDMVVNSETALDRWLNAFEYHRDDAKATELIKAHDPIPVDSSRPIFIMMLREKIDAVLHLAHVVHKILTDPAELVAG